MKYSSICLSLTFLFASFVAFGEGVPEKNYTILSDTALPSIPEGKCLVHGIVTIEKESFEGCKIATEDSEFDAITNASGEYQFLMDAKEFRIYAYQPGYNEVVTEKYNFKSGHSVHVDFYMSFSEQIEINLKPVIYAYNDADLEVDIEMELAGDITFSYPEYNEGWNVIVKKEGLLVKDKLYPYLFWEGETPGLNFQSSESHFRGCQIKTDSTVSFLENQCEAFGLNQIETTDFITFWGPRIQSHKYAKIEFLVDEQYDVVGKLNINPKPDNVRRVYVLFEGGEEFKTGVVSTSVSVKPISRKGFTVVEWGGTELHPNKKMNP